ncbi:uncharacterized protein TNCV_4585971 [Trichonephila clavipes]|nr:uncharacterized protein TNCV_4585971 [Trichonephila clavipes]
MPPNTLRVHTEYVFFKSVGPKVSWVESRVQGQENISLPSVPCLNCEGEIGGVAIYRPFENFSELNRTVTCMVLKARPTTGVHPAPCHKEFLGPRSDYVKQVALETTAVPETM